MKASRSIASPTRSSASCCRSECREPSALEFRADRSDASPPPLWGRNRRGSRHLRDEPVMANRQSQSARPHPIPPHRGGGCANAVDSTQMQLAQFELALARFLSLLTQTSSGKIERRDRSERRLKTGLRPLPVHQSVSGRDRPSARARVRDAPSSPSTPTRAARSRREAPLQRRAASRRRHNISRPREISSRSVPNAGAVRRRRAHE